MKDWDIGKSDKTVRNGTYVYATKADNCILIFLVSGSIYVRAPRAFPQARPDVDPQVDEENNV
jgi:hypothetical protein